jgi:hypothetical protein
VNGPVLPEGARRVGIAGVPPLAVMAELERRGAEILDLDAMLVDESIECAVTLLPRVYCAVLRTVVVNALHLDLDLIVIDTGPGKCDAAAHTAAILRDRIRTPIITTRNQDTERQGNPVCVSGLPLVRKMELITESVKSAAPRNRDLAPCRATAGFWGVPPRDFSLLGLFPDSTHVFGWSRCMENKTPADAELEAMYDPTVPTVFFAQSFCAKTALARHLAAAHPRGLYLDVDATATASARAKIEAFLELSGAWP